VTISDFLTLVQNTSTRSGKTFVTGDFNGDGMVPIGRFPRPSKQFHQPSRRRLWQRPALHIDKALDAVVHLTPRYAAFHRRPTRY